MTAEPTTPDPILDSAISALRSPIGVRAGLPERARQRKRSRRRQRRLGGGATLLAAILIVGLTQLRTPHPASGTTFSLVAPSSSGISLVGDFTGWQKDQVRLKRTRGDHWKVTLVLPPGRYRFAYVTDGGKWLADPNAAPAFDDFGRPTSVLTVATR